MGKNIVPVKSVVYALSPFQQKIMSGLWKDLPTKIHHKVSENWISALLLITPVVGTYSRMYDIYLTLTHVVCYALCGTGEAAPQVLSSYEDRLDNLQVSCP
ncbi:cytochrome b-c1 complex subunit 8-like protein [Trifolium pratense]|uniref:Cytochrome b-c1 complex subunit 8-like protein n=2 Tax=Trifolium TaxID=3898 RepID=A0A2K3L451_TRIPR|nr:cytochrome b-c1 complex subunit 8-like protein [Trifolium pratense]